MIRVFIGTDRSQMLPAKVLIHSLKATTKSDIKVELLDYLKIPEPKDVRQSQRTGFSFARWGIPELCNYKGKALYLDADMLVFKDVKEIWDFPMKGTISIVDGTNAEYCLHNVKLNKNETSVMLLNCGQAHWTLQGLVAGLDGQYTYKEMMSDLCFLKKDEIQYAIPRSWNSMDYYDDSVNLLHYTNVPTQPWVSLDNPYGYVWVDYLKSLIKEGYISFNDVKEEIAYKYIRPSLALEIEEQTALPSDFKYIEKLKRVDSRAGYIPHLEVHQWNMRRANKIKEYERNLAKEQGLLNYARFEFKNLMQAFLSKVRMK